MKIEIGENLSILLILIVVIVALIIGGIIDHRNIMEEKNLEQQTKSKAPCGYTKIEFGVGVDCHGDTIKINETYLRK